MANNTDTTNLQITAEGHAELIRMFEREPDYRGRRLDKEAKALWAKGNVYQDGHVNALFIAYRRGAAYGLTIGRAAT